MEQVVKNSRLAFILMGVVSLLFGIVAVIFTPDTVDVLYTFLAVFWILTGLCGIFGGLVGAVEHRWVAFLLGILAVVMGVVALRMPLTTIVVLMVLLGFWALVSGFSELFGAFTAGGMGGSWGWTALDGVLSILMGVLMIAAPFDSLNALVWVIGIYAIVRGVVLILGGLQIGKSPAAA